MGETRPIRPWAALWALVLGFFMILVDTTIVAVANPTIMEGLDTTMTATLWATSSYLLAYAVPLLITGRLGDRFGPRRIYLTGLTIFTLASLLCGLAPTIHVLVAARALQGVGASMMTPQTMAVITRIFAPNQRGSAMAIWGVVAGVATMVGPILGGFILDVLGWEWIFFVNVPLGIVAFALAHAYIPRLPTNSHAFDILGVLLSALGTFLIIFGIQEGETYAWSVIWGPVTVWRMIGLGVLTMGVFVWWQHRNTREPLMPLNLFRNRNFTVGSAAISLVGLTTTAMALPLMFYFQLVRGLTPTQSALMLLPMAVLSIVLARPIGRIVDRSDARRLNTLGLVLQGVGVAAYIPLFDERMPLWLLLIPSVIIGCSNSMMWGPLASLTTYSLPHSLAGSGAGVYNSSRQIGAVLGSALITMLMTARLTDVLGVEATTPSAAGGVHQLPEALRAGYAEAMGQAMLLPVIAVLVGACITLFYAPRPSDEQMPSRR